MHNKHALYHSVLLAFLAFLAFLAAACTPSRPAPQEIQITILADGAERSVRLPLGATVQEALQAAGLTVGELDRVDPPLYTLLGEEREIRIVRVREEFEVLQETIPFERQTLRSESLPAGETRLLQSGVNGLREVTIRRLYENGEEISQNAVKVNVIREPVPEIVMVGSQSASEHLEIPGKLVYLDGGNVWLMEGSTTDRTPLLTLGDLDGRIFSLSADGEWLLFTRTAQGEESINTLWAARLNQTPPLVVDLQVENVIHFADWVPGSTLRVAYSTVEPRSTAPGWQANNDLQMRSFSTSGWVSRPTLVADANAGGIYGWWGTSFAWSPNGRQMAFARPDGVGLVDFETGEFRRLLEITPFQTYGDWAWVPGVAWSPRGDALFTVDHLPLEGDAAADETSPLFGVTALPLEAAPVIHLLNQTGMFARPVPSPLQPRPEDPEAYLVAYLQAISPQQSDTSRYRLAVVDRDGSNRRVLFPQEGAPGLEPQRVFWSPAPLPGDDAPAIAFLYQGDLWIVDVLSGEAQQITGDGLVTRLDWR